MKKQILILLGLLIQVTAWTQTYPVSAMPQLLPPNSIYLSDYTAAGSDKFTLNIALNDFNESEYGVRLQLTIAGEGAFLQTSPDFNPQPLTLFPGNNALTGNDLEEYFNLNNMMVAGIDDQELRRTGALPPGIYSFCVEAFDYRRSDVRLSLKGCTTVTLQKNNPPLLVYPECGSIVPTQDVNNILFQWQTQADRSIQAEYTVEMVEVPHGMNPDDALNGAGRQVLLPNDAVTMQTQFLYGNDQLPLEIGKSYAYRVKIEDIEGSTTIENNGTSPSCLFHYGAPTNGTIELTRPKEGYKVRNDTENLNFSWNKPDNVQANQKFYYKLKLVEVGVGQTAEEAIQNNVSFREEFTDEQVYIGSTSLKVTDIELPFANVFAWQVEAYVEDTKIGASDIRTFNKGAIMEQFEAGEYMVTVTSNSSNDLNNFSGYGTVKLDETDSLYRVKFDNIKLDAVGNYVLTEGEVIARLDDYKVDLDFGKNGEVNLHADQAIFTKDDLLLRGEIKWLLPHPTTNTLNKPYVVSEKKRFKYNSYKIIDDVNFKEVEYELLEPYGFKMRFYPSSTFSIRNSVLTAKMNIKTTLPSNMKTLDGKVIELQFKDIDNAYYLINPDLGDNQQGIKIIDNTTITLHAKAITFDLSEEKSPTLKGDAAWKGMYFDQFKINYPKAFDGSQQLASTKELLLDYSLSSGQKAWVTPTGLELYVEEDFKSISNEYGRLNHFKGAFSSATFDIRENIVNNSNLIGYIIIPGLSETDKFTFDIAISDDGFEESALDNLDGYSVVKNKDKDEEELKITVNKGVFKDKKLLELNVTLDWVKIEGAKLENLSNLRFWGKGDAGFGSPNGKKNLTTRVEAALAGKYVHTIKAIQVARLKDGYYYGYEGEVAMGNDVSGNAGPPQMKVSTKATYYKELESDEIENYTTFYVSNADTMSITAPTISMSIKGVIALQNGPLTYTRNDPVWGSGFRGSMTIKVFNPKEFTLGAGFIYGSTRSGLDDQNAAAYNYWAASLSVSTNEDIDEAEKMFYTPLPDLDDPDYKKNLKQLQGHLQEKESREYAERIKKRTRGVEIPLGFAKITRIGGQIFHHMNYEWVVNEWQLKPNKDMWGGLNVGIQIKSMDEKFTGELDLKGMMSDPNSLEELRVKASLDVAKKGKILGEFRMNIPKKTYTGILEFTLKKPICVFAPLRLDIDQLKNIWSFEIGRRSNRFKVAKCAGFSQDAKMTTFSGDAEAGLTGWLHITNEKVGLGIGAYAAASVKSDWLDLGLVKLRGSGSVSVAAVAEAELQYKPELRMNKVGLFVEADANVGFDWDTALDSGSVTLAEFLLRGNIYVWFPEDADNLFTTDEDETKHRLKGDVTVKYSIIGISGAFDANFTHQW